MKGTYTKTVVHNFNEDLKWYTDDANNTIKATCGTDEGKLVQASAVLARMGAPSSYPSKAAFIIDWYKQAAILSLGIEEGNIT